MGRVSSWIRCVRNVEILVKFSHYTRYAITASLHLTLVVIDRLVLKSPEAAALTSPETETL